VSALEALKAARVAGVELRVDGEALILEAAAPPPAEVIDLLSRNKSALGALLRPGEDGSSAEDWRGFSTSGWRSPNATRGLHVKRPRRALSGPVSSSGSTAIRSTRRRTAAAGAVVESAGTLCCSGLAPIEEAMLGCTAPAGGHGKSIGRLRRSLLCGRSGSPRQATFQTISRKMEFP
jgi:hypothetical protein